MDHQGQEELVLDDRRFLAEVHHAFLIRRPEEIAASWYALEHDMRIIDSGIEILHDLLVAVRDAGGHAPAVVDSDDLVARPVKTMTAYCAAVGIPFIPDALVWDRGERPEWGRSSRWHEDAAAGSVFEKPQRPDRHGLSMHSEVMRFARRHSPFYEMLRDHRLDVTRSGANYPATTE